VNLPRLRAIFWKEFIQMRRDRATLGLMLGVPVMQLLLFGYAIRQEVRNLPTAVFDQSQSRQSRELVERLQATDNFLVTRRVRSYGEAIALVDQGRVKAAVVIPEDYAPRLKSGRPVQVQVLVDATDPTASQSAIAAAQLVGQRENLAQAERLSSGRIGPDAALVDVRVRPLYNPALKSVLFIVPGIVGMLLSNMLIIITAMSVVREREHGTLEQLIVTPLTRTEIMLGKIAPYVVVGYVQMTAVLLVGHLLFRVPIRGSIPLIYVISLLFITANLGLGLFISTLTRSSAAAMQGSFFFLLPNILLSGFMFPREAMPHVAYEIGWLLPLTHYLQVIRGIVLKGVGLPDLWVQTLALLGFAVLFFSFSVRRFHKQLE
jgi:ABC-2 type transport system permease protein